MVYQLPQTYPFACPQAKQTDSLSERGLEIAGTHRLAENYKEGLDHPVQSVGIRSSYRGML